jgi:hypothetical protein
MLLKEESCLMQSHTLFLVAFQGAINQPSACHIFLAVRDYVFRILGLSRCMHALSEEALRLAAYHPITVYMKKAKSKHCQHKAVFVLLSALAVAPTVSDAFNQATPNVTFCSL